jgi:hypothetical protein
METFPFCLLFGGFANSKGLSTPGLNVSEVQLFARSKMSEKFAQTPHYLVSIQIVPQNFEVILALPHHTQI